MTTRRPDDWPKTQCVTMPSGHTLQVLPHRAKAHDFATWEGPFVREIAACLAGLAERGEDVLDVGAEEGEFSALWGRIVGPDRVHMFEPTPSVWPNIRATWERNHPGMRAGTMFPGFVGLTEDARHTGAMMVDDVWPAQANGPIQMDSRFSVTTERPDIPATSLDLWWRARRGPVVPRVGAIVCDVEGAEAMVFAGARELLAACKPVVFVSVHPPSFFSRFPSTERPLRWGEQEHLFRIMAQTGYAGRFLAEDHESHWRFDHVGR